MTATKTLVLLGPGVYFGRETALRFAEEGFHIVLVARDEARLTALVSEIVSRGFTAQAVVADVCDAEGFAEKVALSLKDCPPIGAVIYNVKRSLSGNGLSVTTKELNDAFAVNVTAAVTCLQILLPYMEPGSSFMLTGGGYKDTPDPNKIALSVSKSALHTLFLSLVEPLLAHGVLAKTLVIDGVVRTEGPILPTEVADSFWKLYLQKSNDPLYIKGA